MALTTDIVASWRHPRDVFRRKLAEGVREDRALAILVGACVLIFIAQWPRLAREAHLDPAIPLEARIGGALLALIFLAPLVFYILAGLSHLALRMLNRHSTAYGARLALFWALLAASPLILVQGLIAGLAGSGAGLVLSGLGVLVCFLALWGAHLAELSSIGSRAGGG